jgi:hypothetical protein
MPGMDMPVMHYGAFVIRLASLINPHQVASTELGLWRA